MEEQDGRKVVVKRNKPAKDFNEFILVYTYSLISVLLARPSGPPALGEVMQNEGREMRERLQQFGVPTPELISISDSGLVEEYIEGGDLYNALASGRAASLAYEAGCLTGRMHRAGYAFVDNKAQNFLAGGDSVIRTDLGFIKKGNSSYAQSMDIGSFLASVMDLARYSEIEKEFHRGYLSESGHAVFPYLSIVIRNLLSLGFSSDSMTTLQNMLLDSRMLVSA